MSVTQIPLTPDKMAEELASMKRNMDYFIEHQKLMAKIHRASFLALMEEGFTALEALELCKTP